MVVDVSPCPFSDEGGGPAGCVSDEVFSTTLWFVGLGSPLPIAFAVAPSAVSAVPSLGGLLRGRVDCRTAPKRRDFETCALVRKRADRLGWPGVSTIGVVIFSVEEAKL